MIFLDTCILIDYSKEKMNFNLNNNYCVSSIVILEFKLERGDEVVGLDNINDYYDVNLKYGRLKELGISGADASASESELIQSSLYPKHKFIKLDLADRTGMEKLFKEEKFDAVMHLEIDHALSYRG